MLARELGEHRLKDLAGSRMTSKGEIVIAARRFGAERLVDPRPAAVGSIREFVNKNAGDAKADDARFELGGVCFWFDAVEKVSVNELWN